MPDLSRSYCRKIVCKDITEDMKGRLSCGLQAACPPSLLPLCSAPGLLSSSPASSGSCSTGSGTPPARGGRCRLSEEQRVKEVEAPRKGGSTKAKLPDPSHRRWEKPGHTWPAQFFPPTFILQHQQNKSLQASKERVTLELAAMPLPGSSCAAAVGSTLLCCPWTKAGLACREKECYRARLEKVILA